MIGAQFLPLAELAFNNVENASIHYTPFYVNYGYHSQMDYLQDGTLHSVKFPNISKNIQEIEELKKSLTKNIAKSNSEAEYFANKTRLGHKVINLKLEI